jgi:thioredoxin 2
MSDALHIVCPHCETINRTPTARLGVAPKCGSCHRDLFTGHPIELTDNNFRRHVDRNDLPVLVDFWASWCGPCQAMAPQYVQATAELEPQVRVGKLNTDEAQKISAEFGIRSIPTLMLFKSGREVARQAGAMGQADIIRWVRTHL